MGTRTNYRNSQLHQELCDQLREAREAVKMTQYDVSAAIKRPPEFCNKVEHGSRVLNSMELIMYCRAIGTTAAKVLSAVERIVLMKRSPLK